MVRFQEKKTTLATRNKGGKKEDHQNATEEAVRSQDASPFTGGYKPMMDVWRWKHVNQKRWDKNQRSKRGGKPTTCSLVDKGILLLFFNLGLHHAHSAQYGHDENLVVDKGTRQKQDKADDLKIRENLPRNSKAVDPDRKRADAIQDHACRGGHLLCDADAAVVEKGDTDNRAADGQGDGPRVVDLDERIVDVLKGVASARAGHKHEDDAEKGHDHHAKDALPADSLERLDLVLADKLLLNDHLDGHNDLGADDQNVAKQRVAGVVIRAAFKESSNSNKDQANENKEHAGPVGRGELAAEPELAQETREDDDRAAKHLKLRGVGQREAQVHR
eukprot:m.294596 g.294596  ORF g.294596 m.294596 type:complete len:332 (+) comp13028_c0_seq1:172-1167(+)